MFIAIYSRDKNMIKRQTQSTLYICILRSNKAHKSGGIKRKETYWYIFPLYLITLLGKLPKKTTTTKREKRMERVGKTFVNFLISHSLNGMKILWSLLLLLFVPPHPTLIARASLHLVVLLLLLLSSRIKTLRVWVFRNV